MANSFNHVQSTASSVWTIAHNLNSVAVVLDVYVDNLGTLEKMIPAKVRHIDDNTVEITFSVNQVGNVRIVT